MRIKLTNLLGVAAVLVALGAGSFDSAHMFTAQAQQQKEQAKPEVIYACPMHADVKSHRPGKCPKCGMRLQLVKAAASVAKLAPRTEPRDAATAETAHAPALHIPDTTVYDQTGRRLNFYSDLVKGRTVAINFIFTTCTTICPPLTATFRRVQQELGARVGHDVSLISISVDPTTDVPARLREFSARFKAAPGWTFVTGSKPEIDQLLDALGAAVPDKNDHTPMVLIGNDATGYWTRAYGLASAATLVKAINDAEAQGHSAVSGGDTNARVPLPGADASAAPAPEKQLARGVTVGTTRTEDVANAGAPVALAADKSGAKGRPGASYFPNLVLLTQDAQPVHFYNDLLKDKVVLINFVFTTCKGACSPMTANLAKVQQYLGEHLGKEIVMLSISVDPTVDTPVVLKKFAANFKARPGWYFLTGKKENVDWVLYKLGGYVEDKNQHNLAVIIGNEKTGDWLKMHGMANPSDIADAALKLLAAN